jgi:methionine sulfoxide reductase catalytic subunit
MLIRKPDAISGSNILSSEITPKEKWLNRRSLLAGAAATGALALGADRFAEMLSPPRTVLAAGKLNTVPSPLSTTGE